MANDTSHPQIRHDWYQTESHIVVTILIKNVKQSDLSVKYTETKLTVDIKPLGANGNEYSLDLNLAHKIVPDKCSFKLMATKIEIKLMKLDGVQWGALEGPVSELRSIPKEVVSSAGPPRYPTSNPLHRDWDAIEREIVKELAQEKPAGEDGVNQLFQKIYGEGSDEVKRAMNKSYMESGGTVLSTNWNEISKDKVPVKPPDGMEWKQWNE